MTPVTGAVVFAVAYAALYTGHVVGDIWVQTSRQALDKGLDGWRGIRACAAHVATITATQAAVTLGTLLALGLRVHAGLITAALAVTAASHYAADRRRPLEYLARLVGKGDLWQLGAPRPDRDDNPSLGTGAFHLDQAWHLAWLWAAALIIAL